MKLYQLTVSQTGNYHPTKFQFKQIDLNRYERVPHCYLLKYICVAHLYYEMCTFVSICLSLCLAHNTQFNLISFKTKFDGAYDVIRTAYIVYNWMTIVNRIAVGVICRAMMVMRFFLSSDYDY